MNDDQIWQTLRRILSPYLHKTFNADPWDWDKTDDRHKELFRALAERQAALEEIGKTEERIKEDSHRYTACAVCHNPIGRKTLLKNQCEDSCVGNIARNATGGK